ncbi:MAG: hypothetical protein Rhirs2KO_34980 [Rhizobiaceae bacterium]
MADIPDNAVIRRVENVVERNSQLDNAQSGAEMPARLGHCIDEFGAQFLGELRQFSLVKLAKVIRDPDAVQQRRGGVATQFWLGPELHIGLWT